MQQLHSLVLISLLSFTCQAADQTILQQEQMSSDVAEKPLVVIIPSYKNSQWYQLNLDSIFNQKYSNYRVIYIDDCSPDGTGDLVQQYIHDHGLEHKITLIKNEVRQGALSNIYRAIHMCKDFEIMVTVDGDDWLKGDFVFARLNQAYADPKVWMTYGQYEDYPHGNQGNQKALPQGIIIKNVYREYDWVTSHLRTFYAGLFKKIKLEDFLFEGSFFDVTWDMAFMFPMLEMSREHACFIPEVLYVYNQATPSNDFKTKLARQIHCDHLIRAKDKYQKLSTLSFENTQKSTIDVIIFSFTSPVYLYALLESMQSKLHGANDIKVLYYAADQAREDAYQAIKEIYPTHTFIACTATNVKEKMIATLDDCKAPYILLAHDGIVVTRDVDLQLVAHDLEKTHAHGFYLTLGKNIKKNGALVVEQKTPPSVWLENGTYAWQFNHGEHDWRRPFSTSMVVYNKESHLDSLQDLYFKTPQDLQEAWNSMNVSLAQVGLYFEESKAFAREPEKRERKLAELVALFNAGFKLDENKLKDIQNKSMVVTHDVLFIKR